MATNLAVRVIVSILCDFLPTAPAEGPPPRLSLNNGTDGARLVNGTGSGQANQPYMRDRGGVDADLLAGATDSYNVLAAGALVDMYGTAIDLDEVKALMVVCDLGAIKVVGGAANPLGCFTGAGEGFKLASGQSCLLDLGATGLTVGASGTFEITETTTANPAQYRLILVGAS